MEWIKYILSDLVPHVCSINKKGISLILRKHRFHMEALKIDRNSPFTQFILQKQTDRSIMLSGRRLLPLPWSSPRPVGWRTWPWRSLAAWAVCLFQELCNNPVNTEGQHKLNQDQWRRLNLKTDSGNTVELNNSGHSGLNSCLIWNPELA